MEFLQALLLGIVEGFTEFLPVSSTGHLLLIGHFIGFKSTGFTFEILVQLGAILAILSVYFGKLITIAKGALTDMRMRMFIIGVLVAFLPAAFLGALFSGFIKGVLFNPLIVCCMLIAGGLVLLVVDEVDWKPKYNDITQFSLWTCLRIGLFQCIAMIPGVSRSGATIVGAMLMGADKRTAAEFSFFLAMPTMVGAFSFDLLKHRNDLTANDLAVIGVGFVAAFFAALIVVRGFLAFVSSRASRPSPGGGLLSARWGWRGWLRSGFCERVLSRESRGGGREATGGGSGRKAPTVGCADISLASRARRITLSPAPRRHPAHFIRRFIGRVHQSIGAQIIRPVGFRRCASLEAVEEMPAGTIRPFLADVPRPRGPGAKRRRYILLPDKIVAGHAHLAAGADDDRAAVPLDLDQCFGEGIGNALGHIGTLDNAHRAAFMAQHHGGRVLAGDSLLAALRFAGNAGHLAHQIAGDIEHMHAYIRDGELRFGPEIGLRLEHVEGDAEADPRPIRRTDRTAVDHAAHLPHRVGEAEVLMHREPNTGLLRCLDDGDAIGPCRREGFLHDGGDALADAQFRKRAMRVLPRDDIHEIEFLAVQHHSGVRVVRDSELCARSRSLCRINIANGCQHRAFGGKIAPAMQVVLRVETAADDPDPD